MSKLKAFFAKFIPALREHVLSLADEAEQLADDGLATFRDAVAKLEKSAELKLALVDDEISKHELYARLAAEASEAAERRQAEAQKLEATASRVADLIGDPLL